MGKGDRKTKKGKRFAGSYGKLRKRKNEDGKLITKPKKVIEEEKDPKKKTTSKKKKTTSKKKKDV